MATIALRSISKRFGETSVLEALDLDVRNGEFLTLVGPSGCGKSTLLRIIAGLDDASDGTVSIDDAVVNDVRASDRNLAMVFQSYALYPHLSVRRNMETPVRLRQFSWVHRLPLIGRFFPGYRRLNRDLVERVQGAARTLKIEHLLDRKPGQLSGGQRQRVALGRAMVRQPAAFLMDEPLSNLDAALRVHMRAELSQLHQALDTTFIYVTHDQAEALTMSDRMAVMLNGRIVQLGTPDEVYQFPATREVACFVGSPQMNLVPVNVLEQGHAAVCGIDAQASMVPAHLFTSAREIGVRAEDLQLIDNPAENDCDLAWQIEVAHKENLGAEGYLHGDVVDTDLKLIVRVSAVQQRSIGIGERCRVGCRLESLHHFDGAGKRIGHGIGHGIDGAVEPANTAYGDKSNGTRVAA